MVTSFLDFCLIFFVWEQYLTRFLLANYFETSPFKINELFIYGPLEPCVATCSFIHFNSIEKYGEKVCLLTLFPELCIPSHWLADYSPVLLETLTYEKTTLT